MASSGSGEGRGIAADDPSRHPGHVGRASPLLFSGLLDDAAMFPPGNAPLERAVAAHVVDQQAWYADLIGPFLVPAGRVTELAEHVDTQGFSTALRTVVIARDGLPAARTALAAASGGALAVVGVELPMDAVDDLAGAWRELGRDGRAVWWEIDREGYLREQLGRLAGAATAAGAVGGAKLRTGGETPGSWCPEGALAAFLRHAIDLELTFKLTAGLHHAVRCTQILPGPEEPLAVERHGVLNILCAVRAALNGAEEPELVDLLAERDPAPLVGRVHGMSEADASVVRAFWASFGCCGVTEPIGEIAGLGLLTGLPEVRTAGHE